MKWINCFGIFYDTILLVGDTVGCHKNWGRHCCLGGIQEVQEARVSDKKSTDKHIEYDPLG